MSRAIAITTAAVLWAYPTLADVTIPPAQRITASIERTIEAPADVAMKMPTDVAVDASGTTYVADGVNHRVVEFSADGSFSATHERFGDARLDNPVGLCVDADGRLWIADSGAQCVWVFDRADGTHDRIDVPRLESGRHADVTDVAVTPDGKRAFIVDNDNHRILTFDPANDLWREYGGRGRAVGEFEWPFQVSIGSDGTALIVDTLGSRIQRISAEGKWSRPLGRWGVEIGCLYRPKGVAYSAAGLIYVSDSTLGVVQAFRETGRLEGVLCDDAGAPLRFAHPMGMCFDKQGRLYVVELRASRVAIVAIKTREEAPADEGKLPEQKAE